MRGVGKWLGLSPIAALAFVLVLSGSVAASGSGYNQSFSQAASGSNANADMTAVSTNDPGGANVSVQFTVAGQVILNSDTYVYEVWFGGSTAGNATAYGIFSNNSTNGFYLGYGSNSGSYGNLPYTLSGGGSTLSFSIAKAILPPSSSFTLNAVAVYVSGSSYSYSWLGSDYGLGGGGSGSCTGNSCTLTPAASAFNYWIVIIPVIVIVVVVVVVLMLVMRKKKGTPPPPMGQPGQPAWGAQPPAAPGQPTWQNPPPPPGTQ